MFVLYSLLNKKMLDIVESKRKKPTLLLDGFRYTQDKIFNTTIYWKCESRSRPGRALQWVYENWSNENWSNEN